MLEKCSRMLVSCKKCKEGVKGFQTHSLSWHLDKNSLTNANLKIHDFSSFFIIFYHLKFSIFAKMQKCLQSEFYIFQWIYVQNACKVVRWKALYIYFAFAHFASICEHPTSIYGHMYEIKENVIFHDIFAFIIQKCSCLLGECSEMLISCINAKYDAKAVQRTSLRINWTKSLWERRFRIQTNSNKIMFQNSIFGR